MVPPNACPNPHYTAVELAASQMSRSVLVAFSLCRSAKRQRSKREKRKQRLCGDCSFLAGALGRGNSACWHIRGVCAQEKAAGTDSCIRE